jgi:hypothetical protein
MTFENPDLKGAAMSRQIDAYNRMAKDRRKRLENILVENGKAIAPPPEGERSPEADALFFRLMASGYTRDEILGACMMMLAPQGRG